MPVKLPDPLAGTDEQAGPNGAIAEPDVEAAGWAALAFGVAGDAADELVELHAAAPTAMVAAAAATPRNLYFMIFSSSNLDGPPRDCGGRKG
jgi:hypothetical protein